MASSIDKIPNSISGDGSSFVAQLKKALADFRSDVRDIDEGDTSAFCQPVTNITLTQRKQGEDNFIDVSWNKESVYGYKEAFVFYKPINTTRWILSFNTEGTSGVIEGVQVGTRYAVRVVPHNIDGGYDKNPTDYYIDVVSSMVAPTTPQQFFVNFDSGEGHWEWKYEGPYDFFELRTDTNVGVTSEYLLARTNRKEVFKEPNILQGTAYLYVRNNFGVYGVPATTTFNITEENKPPKPSISRGANGINIHMTPNENYASYVVQIEELEYETDDNPFYLARTRGALRTRYRWKNGTAYSGWSNWIIVNISELIDTEDLVDNCITSDKISAGAVTAGKLYAGNIEMAGNLAIVGGAVTLNENGLRCVNESGDSVIFDNSGMRFVDENNNQYASVGRMIIGQAKHGQKVVFNTPWTSVPYVLVMPQRFQTSYAGYSEANLETLCNATYITKNGFTIQCYTRLTAGSSGTSASVSIGSVAPGNFSTNDRISGTKTYVIGTKTLTVPAGATHAVIPVSVTYSAPYEIGWGGNSDTGTEYVYYTPRGSSYVKFEVLVNGSVSRTYSTPTITSVPNSSTNSTNIDLTFTSGATIQVKATLYVTYNKTYYGSEIDSQGTANATLGAYSFDISSGNSFMVGTGTATFIAIESLNADYILQ